jgi:hypothetical protein
MASGFELLGSLVVGAIGLFMLLRGKKTADTRQMVWGGILLVLSYLLFS